MQQCAIISKGFSSSGKNFWSKCGWGIQQAYVSTQVDLEQGLPNCGICMPGGMQDISWGNEGEIV